jgi:transcriptional regulator with XRE-family HTH domain
MTGTEFRRLRRHTHLSVHEAADLCGVAPATIHRWERAAGAAIPPRAATLRAQLDALHVDLRIAFHAGRAVARFAPASALGQAAGPREVALLETPASGWPVLFELAEEGAFWLGYYQQRADPPARGETE